MSRNRNKPNNKKGKYKRPTCKKQRRKVLRYLKKHTATAAMVSVATGIPLENVRWHKWDLEKAGHLFLVKHDNCQTTGHLAWYLSTNPHFGSTETKTDKVSK